jgi:hypothetical protein
MRVLKYALIAAFAFLFLGMAPNSTSHVQAQIVVGIGAAPGCPYGYYGYAPYNCAPYGYYGPEWFNGGIFLGAGPWHHGPAFYGHVNRAYDPRFGYHGGFPGRGPYREPPDHFHNFHATHYSDARGSYHTEAQHGRYVHR